MIDLTKGSYQERLKNGDLLLFSRNTTFYARIYKVKARDAISSRA